MLTEIGQVKAAFHPLRLRIIEVLAEGPATPSEVGRRLGIAASKAHYHVGVLEKHGLVKLVESRTTSGITEHFYQAVAHKFVLQREPHAPGLAAVMQEELMALVSDVQAAIPAPGGEKPPLVVSIQRLSATPDNREVVEEQIERLRTQVERALAQSPGRAYRLVVAWAPIQDDDAAKEEPEC